HRLLGIPVPLAVLFTPLIIEQITRGTPLGVLADPGVAVAVEPVSAWHLAIGDPGGSWLGWVSALEAVGLPGGTAPIVVATLSAPIILLALLSMFLPGATRALVATITALLGFITAVAAGQLLVASLGAHPLAINPTSGVSLYWLGLTL